MKHCPKCNNDLPLSKFGSNAVAKDGKNWYCKDCAKFMSKAKATRAAIRKWIQQEPNSCARCGNKSKIFRSTRIFVNDLNSTIKICSLCCGIFDLSSIANMGAIELYNWLRERRCKRCEHIWKARSRQPQRCSKCKSLKWMSNPEELTDTEYEETK